MIRKIFYRIWHFFAMMRVAFVMIFIRPIEQIHNEDQETDKQKFARIPIGIYPLQYFVTQFQIIHNLQKLQNESLLELLNALKAQNRVIERFFNIISPEKVDKTEPL